MKHLCLNVIDDLVQDYINDLVFTPYSVKQNQFTKTYANQLYNKRFQSSDHFQVILKIYKGIKDKAHFQMNSKNKYHNRNNNRNSYANTLSVHANYVSIRFSDIIIFSTIKHFRQGRSYYTHSKIIQFQSQHCRSIYGMHIGISLVRN